jgi:hypothetical protein
VIKSFKNERSRPWVWLPVPRKKKKKEGEIMILYDLSEEGKLREFYARQTPLTQEMADRKSWNFIKERTGDKYKR